MIKDGPYAEVDPPWESNLLDAISPSTYNPQTSSPLFVKLSAELRLQIFRYVLAEYEDRSRPYKPSDHKDEFAFIHYSRPGWEAPWLIDTSLLHTCRRVYLEAGHLPMRLATLRFCYDIPSPHDSYGGPDKYSEIGKVGILDVTRNNLANVTKIHIQTSSWGLQEARKMAFFYEWENYRGPDPFPNLETLTITVGWARWFSEGPGYFDYDQFDYDDWPEVKKFLRLEFETDTHDEDHVKSVDDMLEEWRGGRMKFETINGTPLVADTRRMPVKSRRKLSLEGRDGSVYYTDKLGYDYPSVVEFEVTRIDYVPAREPRWRKDLDL